MAVKIRSPSCAVAPVGSPSTPFGLTARTPPVTIRGSSSASGAVAPGLSRSYRTVAGCRCSIRQVSR